MTRPETARRDRPTAPQGVTYAETDPNRHDTETLAAPDAPRADTVRG